MTRRRRVLMLGLAGLCAATTTALVLFFGQHTRDHATPPRRPDPRLDYTGPVRNVNPAVGYVAASRCTACHPDVAASFARHPMGRSLLPVAQAPAPPTGTGQHNPFEAFGSLLRVVYEGDQARHVRTRLDPAGRPAAEQTLDVHYVVGSGARGYSYLTDCEGRVFQTPISWYVQKKAWDLRLPSQPGPAAVSERGLGSGPRGKRGVGAGGPMNTEARAAQVSCGLTLGDKAAARAEFARLEALAPANLRELHIRFGKRLR
jgi:hypothetical protein